MSEPVSFGKYTLLDRLASGPVADVYRAVTRTATGGDLPVVVKLIRPEACRDQTFLASFVDEARIASMLEHPNIARTYEWGRHEDTLFIAMEYIEGTNLASLMQSMVEQGLRFPPINAVYIVCEVLIGLVYAHNLKDPYGNQLGLVHRDVSPPNVVLSSAGEVKLVDFGLAKVASKIQATLPGVFGGKFTYMAPEQIRHSNVDQRADIFSCGVILYELLTGQKLRSTGEDASVRAIVDAARTRPPSSVHSDIPTELDQVIVQAMAENPEDRLSLAADMAQSLQTFVDRWDRQVDADTLSSFLVDVLSGRAGLKKEKVGFAFGEATSQWMARGENLEELVKIPPTGSPPADLPAPPPESDPMQASGPPVTSAPVAASPEDLLSQVPGVPAQAPVTPRPEPVAAERPAEVPVEPPAEEAPYQSDFAPPKQSFSSGDTVMAIQEGGLGRGRQFKNLLLVIAVLGLAVVAIVFIVTHLSKEDEVKKKPTGPKPLDTRGFAGAVQIDSVPPGALIFVDGDLVKAEGSPPRIMGLRAGQHRIKLLLPGHLPWEGDVTFEAEKPFVIEQKLEERFGNVVIATKPPNALILMDGKRFGRTPRTLENISAAKTHNVMLKLKRHKSLTFKIEPSDWPEDFAAELTLEKELKRAKRRRRRRRR